MKKLISESYRQQNAALHAKNKKYGSAGHAWTGRVAGYINDAAAVTYLDYGCGKGQLTAAINDVYNKTEAGVVLGIFKYDPVTAPEMPAPADFVTCCDVLEHIEPDYLDHVLEHIASLIQKRGLLVISMRLSNKKLPNGRNAHLIVENESWWMARLAPYFECEIVAPIKEKRIGVELAVLVRPRLATPSTETT